MTCHVLARLRAGPMRFKFAKYMLESGYESVTNQILASGLLPVIVDNNGVLYEQEELPCSQTFRHSSQENLMVTGNQTEAYANADSALNLIFWKASLNIENALHDALKWAKLQKNTFK